MRKLYPFIFVICLFLTVSCKKKSTNDKIDISELKIININSNTIICHSDEIFEKINYIKLETTNDNLIGQITQVLFTDSLIFVADGFFTKSIFVFAYDGSYKYKISGLGGGPHEYINLSHIAFTADNKNLIITDFMKSANMIFSFDGTFIQRIPLSNRGNDFFYIDDTTTVISNPGKIFQGTKNSQPYSLVVENLKTKESYYAFPILTSDDFRAINQLYNLRSYDQKIYYVPYISDMVYQVLPDKIMAQYEIKIEGSKHPKIDKNLKTEEYLDYVQHSRCFNGAFVDLENTAVFGMAPFKSESPVFYAKESGKTYTYKKDIVNDPLASFLGENFTTTRYKKNIIVAEVAPSTIINIDEELKKKNKNNNLAMEDIRKDLTEESNPVLFFYEVNIKSKQ
jgi:hypothetical protein